MSVTIEGLDGVFAGIDALMQSFTENVDQVVQEAGQECRDEAKSRAAVSPDTKEHKGGTMKNSIAYARGTLECSTVCPTYYSVYVERGTYKMKPQPFMLPSFDIASENMQEKLKQL